jgi:hypothetical protein
MKHALLVVFALVIASGSSFAADKPNFSGEWKMNAQKSIFGPAPAPTSLIRKITHDDPSLIIHEDQDTNGEKQVTIRTLTTDGKPSDQQLRGTNVTCSAVWDGSAIVATSIVTQYGVTYSEHMTLSADGKTLTSEVQVSTDQGDLALLIVFDKQ